MTIQNSLIRLILFFHHLKNRFDSPLSQRLRKLCCVPYAALYFLSYTVLVIEIFIVIVKIEIQYGKIELEDLEGTSDNINELLLILAILLGIILGKFIN